MKRGLGERKVKGGEAGREGYRGGRRASGPDPGCLGHLAMTRVAGDMGGHGRACPGHGLFPGPGADSEVGRLPYFNFGSG